MASRSPSILHRIIWLHLLALAGLSIATSAAAYFLLSSTVDDFEARMLRNHAANVASHLVYRVDHWNMKLPVELRAIYDNGYGGYALAVIGDDHRIIYSSLPHAAAFVSEPRKARSEFFQQRRGASTYYAVTVPVTQSGHTAWIQVGQNLQSPDVIVDDVVALFLGRILWIVLPIFVVLLIIDVLLMRRLLAPIVGASHIASLIGPNRPLQRLPTANLPREILPLANAVNQGLERLENALRTQREFTADAAHELRTPLAILRTHVDTMLNNRAARALQADIDSMSHIVDQLLELAELEGVTLEWNEGFDLNTLCAEVVGMMAPIALAEGKSLELCCESPSAWILGEADMLSHALRNLIENAIRYSKMGDIVEVNVSAPATIRILDRGPGVKPAERELIFQRFWRRNRQDKGHSGLGLAIAAKIVQLHHGTISVSDREGGGAIFAITLHADADGDRAMPSNSLDSTPLASNVSSIA